MAAPAPAAAPADGGARLASVVILVGLAARAALAAALPPVTDEAYYADWARHLAAGYYDHPPAVAWLARAGMELLGWNPLGLRFGSLLLQAATVAMAASLARALGGGRAAATAAVLLTAAPVFSLGAALATPDAPLAFAWIGALWALERALSRSPGWFLAAGAFLGLAALSKLTAGLLAVAILAALVLADDGRRALATPWPWAGAALAAAAASPMLLWNAAHGWPAFAYQARHGLAGRAFSVARLGASLGAQAAYLSPLLLLAAVPPAAAALRAREAARRAVAFTALPVVVFFTASASLTPSALPHWPAPGWLSAVVLLAAAGSRWLRAAAWTGFAMLAAGLVALAAARLVPLPALGPGDDPRGWSGALAAARAAAGGARIAAPHWISYGQLSWAAGESVAWVGDRAAAPTFYGEASFTPGEPLLVVTVDRIAPQREALEARLGPLEPAGWFTATDRGVEIRTVRFWRARAPAAGRP